MNEIVNVFFVNNIPQCLIKVTLGFDNVYAMDFSIYTFMATSSMENYTIVFTYKNNVIHYSEYSGGYVEDFILDELEESLLKIHKINQPIYYDEDCFINDLYSEGWYGEYNT